jgi:hypothetical protein
MSDKRPASPSPESIARANRQRLAQEEGARAMADVEKRAVETRNNMQRLRALREAREADETSAQTVVPQPAKKKRKTPIKTSTKTST